MIEHNKETELIRKVLATDLDGTFIPLPGNEENSQALAEISNASQKQNLELIYCTGRHFESVMDVIDTEKLPSPEWIICDVGTSIYRQSEGQYFPFEAYSRHLEDLTLSTSRQEMESIFIGLPGLVLQQADHQQEFKLCYECESQLTSSLVDQISTLLTDFKIPFEAHGSIDPFLNCGLIDILPQGVSKAYALKWLSDHAKYNANQVVYAGDSGNDYLALISGCRAIIVANAPKDLVKKIEATLKEKKKSHALYVAKQEATSGVLAGCKHFGWIE